MKYVYVASWNRSKERAIKRLELNEIIYTR